MSYTKQIFHDGQILTHDHLNHIEERLEALFLNKEYKNGYDKDTHLISKKDYITGKYINNGKIVTGAENYRVAKFKIEHDSDVYLYTKYGNTRVDVVFCFLVKYTDDSYSNIDEILIANTPREVIARTLYLQKGFYAVSWYNKNHSTNGMEDNECIVIAKGNNVKNIKNRNVSTCTLDNSDLLLFNNATIDENNIVTVGGGINNKAIIIEDFQCWHFCISAKFKCSLNSDFSFIIGKDNPKSGGAFQAELVIEDNVSIINTYIGKSTGMEFLEKIELNKITFKSDEQYVIKIFFDTLSDEEDPNRIVTIEIYDDYNNIETFTLNDPTSFFGAPMYYSNSDECIVYDFNLSISHYYDVSNLKAVIFGHSFVQASSINIKERENAFPYLLEKSLGKGRMVNFGYGGDTAARLVPRMESCNKMFKKCPYVLLCIGANDSTIPSDNFISDLQECINTVKRYGATPILFTLSHNNYEMNENMYNDNDWIRNSGYPYVDMYKVFADEDGNCKTDLLLADKVHPNVEGHKMIFQRIKMDCPFLF